jgi:hypothetical protein
MPVIDLQFDITWLTLLATVILPMIVALVTNRVAHPGLKAGILALLALLTSFINEMLANDGQATFDVSSWLATSLAVFLGAVGLHYGLLKPTNVTGSTGAIATSAPGGVGSPKIVEGGVVDRGPGQPRDHI